MGMISGLTRKADRVYIKATSFAADMVEETKPKENDSKAAKAFYALEGMALSAICIRTGIDFAYAGTNSSGSKSSKTKKTGTDPIKTLGDKIKDIFENIYSAISAIMAIVCVVVVVICLLIRMLSKNPRSAETATEWAKRALVAFFIFLILSVIINIINDTATEAGGNKDQPWGN